MTAVVAAGRRILPRGWRDFGVQIVLWLGFYVSYLAVRSVVDRDPSKAIVNGFRVIDFEQRITSRFFEQTAQRVADSSHLLLTAAAWTYWNSEFTVIGLTLLWVYLRRHEWFARFRNTILLTNMIGLVGYVVMPTAPPWMFPYYGFVDGVNHQSGFGALANPVRGDAEPACRRRADRRDLPLPRLPRPVVEGALGDLARLGLVLRPRDSQPFLARRGGGNRGRADLARDRLPGREAPGAARGGCAHRKPAIVGP